MKINAMRKLYAMATLFIVSLAFFACSFVVGFFNVNAKEKIDAIYIAPKLQGYEIDTLPNGVVGQTYPVFECEVIGDDGSVLGNANVLVYNPEGEPVVIENGRFTTSKAGQYKIEYFAEYNTMQASSVLEVNVVDVSEYVAMDTVVVSGAVSEAYSFEKVYLPTIKTTGGFGNVNVKWDIEYTGENVCDGIKIANDENGDFFIPKFPGIYTWKYTATDIVEKSDVETDTITVTDSKIPQMQIPANEKVFHLGETVEFGVSQAKLYDNGVAIYLPITVTVNETDVTSTMKFKPTEKGEYTVKYEAKNPFDPSAESAVYTYKFVVIDKSETTALYVEKFMQLDGFTTEYRKDSIFENKIVILKADGTQEKAQMNFKTAIDDDMVAFSVGFDALETGEHNSNFASVTAMFNDTVNANQNIKFVITATEDNKVKVVVNDYYSAVLDRSMNVYKGNKTYNTLSFEFNPTTKALYENGTLLFNVERNVDGTEFVGFTSGFAYFGMTVDGITDASVVKFYSLAKQVINDDAKDKSKPYFIFPEDYSSAFYADKDGYATIKKLGVFDLYSTSNRIGVKVLAPDKTTLYTTQDMKEDYVFKVEQDGKYVVTYTIADASGNSRNSTATIYVADRISPTIEKVTIAATAKVGDKIELPACVATDNVTEKCVTYIYLIKGNFQKQLVNKEYTFTEQGDHKFIYSAKDEEGNITTITYIVNVAP